MKRIDSVDLALQVRRQIVRMTSRGKTSHVGSGLSIADLLAVLYADFLRVDPSRPDWEDRDRFILSKGHAGAAVYAVLAEVGFFPKEKLLTHCQDGSDLSGHVSHKRVPGVEISTGSLGHGLGIGAGMAYAGKLAGKKHRVVVMQGDGECDEGSVWEAVLFAAHHQLNNLVTVIDYNKLQSLNSVEDTLGLEPFRGKWESFGWRVFEVDGHDHPALRSVLDKAGEEDARPACVIAHTTKGKGVPFMENSVLWHYRSPQGEEYERAMEALGTS